jgi:hypothetical protein
MEASLLQGSKLLFEWSGHEQYMFQKASKEGFHGVVKSMGSPTPCGHADLSRHLKTKILFSSSGNPCPYSCVI